MDENEQLSYYEEIACALVETNTATEINAGLYYRYPVREMCPSPLYLQVLAKYGVPITISSDAHYPNDLGIMYKKIYKHYELTVLLRLQHLRSEQE